MIKLSGNKSLVHYKCQEILYWICEAIAHKTPNQIQKTKDYVCSNNRKKNLGYFLVFNF